MPGLNVACAACSGGTLPFSHTGLFISPYSHLSSYILRWESYLVQPAPHCCPWNRNCMKEAGLPPASEHPSSKVMTSQRVALQLFNASLNLFFVKKTWRVLVVVTEGSMAWAGAAESAPGPGSEERAGLSPCPRQLHSPKPDNPSAEPGLAGGLSWQGQSSAGTQLPAMRLPTAFRQI